MRCAAAGTAVGAEAVLALGLALFCIIISTLSHGPPSSTSSSFSGPRTGRSETGAAACAARAALRIACLHSRRG